jgi:hypothetical protein
MTAPASSDHVGCGSRPPTSIHEAFLSLTGTIFASWSAQGAIVCRAVCNQAMLEPALGWVELVPGIEVNADLL